MPDIPTGAAGLNTGSNANSITEAVCIDTARVYDSCADKDCLSDLRVWFTAPAQAVVDAAATVRCRSCEVLNVFSEIEKVPFSAGVSVESGIMDLTLTSEELSPEELAHVFDGYRKKLSFVRLKNGDFLRLDQNEELAKLV